MENWKFPLFIIKYPLYLFQTDRCYTAEELFAIYHVPEEGLPLEQFSSICPALIQQQLSQACAKQVTEEKGSSRPTDLESELDYLKLSNLKRR